MHYSSLLSEPPSTYLLLKLIILGAIPFLGAEAERSRATGTNGEERGLGLKTHYYQRINYVIN
jgi:hypothetical protein